MRIAFAIVLEAAFLASPGIVDAAELQWPTASYDYVVINQDLRTVLEQFGVNTGLRIVLSDAVQGRVHGGLPPAPPRQFLEHLTEMFGLDWYYDGAAIAVSAKSEAETRLMTLKDTSFSQFRSALESAGFLDPRYQLRPGPETNAAIASGPPQYLAMVKQVAAMLPSNQGPKPDLPTRHNLNVIRGSSISHIEFP